MSSKPKTSSSDTSTPKDPESVVGDRGSVGRESEGEEDGLSGPKSGGSTVGGQAPGQGRASQGQGIHKAGPKNPGGTLGGQAGGQGRESKEDSSKDPEIGGGPRTGGSITGPDKSSERKK